MRINIPIRNEGGDKGTIYIGKELRALQEELQISQEELAGTLCVGQGTLSKYMNDKVAAPFEFVVIIPKKIKTPGAKNITLEWKKKFEEVFWAALTG